MYIPLLNKQINRQTFINRLPDSVFRSDYWRGRIIRAYLSAHEVTKLQIGCGWNLIPGWLNTDVSIIKCKRGAMYLDAGEPFPFPDASFDYVYSEHLFEHLTHPQAVNMLRECHRILKPSGTIRISTPDIRFLADLYLHPEKPLNRRYIDWSSREAPNCLPVPATPVNIVNQFHTAWGHQIIYDRETLTALVTENGFRNIRFCEISRSSVDALNNVECHFNNMPYEFYELETMIMEADR